jgi:hypothetical protein
MQPLLSANPLLQVVPRSSAVLDLPDVENILQLDGDHRQIAQYSSRTDPNYIAVWRAIGGFISSNLSQADLKSKFSLGQDNERP